MVVNTKNRVKKAIEEESIKKTKLRDSSRLKNSEQDHMSNRSLNLLTEIPRAIVLAVFLFH